MLVAPKTFVATSALARPVRRRLTSDPRKARILHLRSNNINIFPDDFTNTQNKTLPSKINNKDESLSRVATIIENTYLFPNLFVDNGTTPNLLYINKFENGFISILLSICTNHRFSRS